MDWGTSTAWWVASGVLVAVELASGTFYLLMLAIGTAAGAVAAHAGLSMTGQLVAAALVGGAAVVIWHQRRSRLAAGSESAGALNLDAGAHVHVDAWSPDGSARVHYRGSDWTARFGGEGPPAPGDHIILSAQGSQLVLVRR
jgi:membrane protein implicated in regulation of membrane protease activity